MTVIRSLVKRRAKLTPWPNFLKLYQKTRTQTFNGRAGKQDVAMVRRPRPWKSASKPALPPIRAVARPPVNRTPAPVEVAATLRNQSADRRAPFTTTSPGKDTVRFSDLQGGLPSDTVDSGGNIDADPFFVDAAGTVISAGTAVVGVVVDINAVTKIILQTTGPGLPPNLVPVVMRVHNHSSGTENPFGSRGNWGRRGTICLTGPPKDF